MSDIFPKTRKSLIITTKSADPEQAALALEALCTIYWRPVFEFMRRRATATENPEDLTQGYFLSLLGRKYLLQADPERGKFRAFLVKDIQFYLADLRRKERAQCRGDGVPPLSRDAANAAGHPLPEPEAPDGQPDLEFDKRFAAALMAAALKRLREESTLEPHVFEELRKYLFWGDGEQSHAEVAATLQMTPGNVKTKVSRLRSLFARILREEVAATVRDPKDVDDELRYLAQLMQ